MLLNSWNNTFYNALQDKDWNAFVYQLGYFCVLATIFILLAVYQLYLNQWLQIRWRRWLTETYLDRWLAGANHYRMQLLGDAADNPDQRIAEDVRQFIDRPAFIPIGLNLLNAVVTLGSFAVILWNLSAAAPFHLFGINIRHPRLSVLGRADLRRHRNDSHAFHRPSARSRSISSSSATKQISASIWCACGKIPSRSRCSNGERAERNGLLAAIRQRGRQLARDHVAAEEAHLSDSRLRAGGRRFSFVVVSPAYFAGASNLAADADGDAFGSVQGCPFVLRHGLSQPCRMARGGRTAWPASTSRSPPRRQRPRRRPSSRLAPSDARAVSFKDLCRASAGGQAAGQRQRAFRSSSASACW